ncbi:glycerol-3-phosphate acyltransferase PlsY [Inquilinus ginsengisoli]|uniref:Glycerol-3-phosphate acyltransferase n=1 Tax=Inquilinus ginsengisoli TaxID=363840 RepID=A0ABU1JGI2_9PROT|nr:glycerol-3-phosphate 1-O-acyltransferase PlsY [Inquilinus ginsengisoli]MDR6287725.1 glycerol-3-phosphate acyltransferase PlsY [Inquilinus ginsengisoli]
MSSFDPTSIWALGAAALLGYLLGSIPFGLVLTKAAGLGDIRSIGSGNIGATNVLRTGHKGLALATLLLDGGKGAVAVLIAGIFDPTLAVLAGGGAMLGHIFPVWLGFKGGKGVATALGTLLAVMWPVGVLCCLVWLVMALLFRMSSLASLTAVAAAPVLGWALSDVPIFGMVWTDLLRAALALFIAVLVFIRHDGNIRRLLRGEEPKIGQKKPAEG